MGSERASWSPDCAYVGLPSEQRRLRAAETRLPALLSLGNFDHISPSGSQSSAVCNDTFRDGYTVVVT
jgi:hypothetical protein